MGNIIPFLGCLIFILPFLATSHIIVDRLPEEINDYNKMENRSGPWQDSNMFRASKLWNFRPRRRNTIEPDEDVGEDSFIIMEGEPEGNNDLSNLEKRGSRQNSNFFRASKRMGFRATKRSSDAKELHALWKRMNFRATKRVGGELVPTQEEEEEEGEEEGEDKDIGIQRREENLSRVQRQLNSHFFRQQRA